MRSPARRLRVRDRWVPRAALAAVLALLVLLAAQAAPAAAGSPAAQCCNGGPAYNSVNTDGHAGAGATAIPYHAGGAVITDPSVTSMAPEPLLFRTSYGGWEPTIGIAADGTIYYAARNSNVDPVPLRSPDAGVTWSAILPTQNSVRTHDVSLDPYLWLDTTTGRVFDTDIGATVTCPPMSFSDDRGASWTNSVVCGHADYEKVFGGPAPGAGPQPTGYPDVVYFCAINGGEGAGSSTANTCSKTLDGGTTWTLTGNPSYPPRAAPSTSPQPGANPPNPNCDGAAPKGTVDLHGTVYLSRGWCDEPWLAISHDEGATWTRVRVPGRLLPFDSQDATWSNHAEVAVDTVGNIYYCWVADDLHPYLTISRNGGHTWSTPLDLLPPGVTQTSLPAIDAGSPGGVAIAVMGTEDSAATIATGNATWNGYVIMSADALDADPVFYTASINDPAGNYLWQGTCPDVRCGNIGDFIDIRIGPDGTPYVALVDSCPPTGAHGEKQCTAFAVDTPRGEAIMGRLVGGPSLRTTGPPSSVPERGLPIAALVLACIAVGFTVRRPRRDGTLQ